MDVRRWERMARGKNSGAGSDVNSYSESREFRRWLGGAHTDVFAIAA